MGAQYIAEFLDGRYSEDEIELGFDEKKAAAVRECEREARELAGGELGSYEDILNTRLNYADSLATVSYMRVEERRFESYDEARLFMYGPSSFVEKWGPAGVCKVRLSDEERARERVTPDRDGYCWVLFAILAC